MLFASGGLIPNPKDRIDMNYYGAQELAASFRTVRNNTIAIAEDIGEAHYGFRVTPDNRTIGQTLVHIARACELQEELHGVRRVTTLEGFDFMGFIGPRVADEQTPRTKEQIVALLRDSGDRFSKWLESLPEELLGEQVTMPTGATPAVSRALK